MDNGIIWVVPPANHSVVSALISLVLVTYFWCIRLFSRAGVLVLFSLVWLILLGYLFPEKVWLIFGTLGTRASVAIQPTILGKFNRACLIVMLLVLRSNRASSLGSCRAIFDSFCIRRIFAFYYSSAL